MSRVNTDDQYAARQATAARRRWVRRSVSVAASVGAHLLVLLAVLWPQGQAPKPMGMGPVTVALVEGPPIEAPPAPPSPPTPTPPKQAAPPKASKAKPSPKVASKPMQAHRPPVTRPEGTPADEASGTPKPGVSEAELAAAETAASSPTGGQCNMTRLLQAALRADARAKAAVASVRRGGEPLVVWRGGWVRSDGEDGDGLAGLREAMLVEIGFAPKACRSQSMHGMVLISFNDGPGAQRIVFGAPNWRWSDMLMLEPEHAGESLRR